METSPLICRARDRDLRHERVKDGVLEHFYCKNKLDDLLVAENFTLVVSKLLYDGLRRNQNPVKHPTQLNVLDV